MRSAPRSSATTWSSAARRTARTGQQQPPRATASSCFYVYRAGRTDRTPAPGARTGRWCARWPAAGPPARGSRSAGSTTPGWTRCSPPVPAGSSSYVRPARSRRPAAAAAALKARLKRVAGSRSLVGATAAPWSSKRQTRRVGVAGPGGLLRRPLAGRGHRPRPTRSPRCSSRWSPWSRSGSVVAVGVGVALLVHRRGPFQHPPDQRAELALGERGALQQLDPVATTAAPAGRRPRSRPIQRDHGRPRGATVGEVPTRVVGASPAPTRVVGASPARVVAASAAPRWAVAGSPAGDERLVFRSPGAPAGGDPGHRHGDVGAPGHSRVRGAARITGGRGRRAGGVRGLGRPPAGRVRAATVLRVGSASVVDRRHHRARDRPDRRTGDGAHGPEERAQIALVAAAPAPAISLFTPEVLLEDVLLLGRGGRVAAG